MRKEELFEIMEDINEDYVKNAKQTKDMKKINRFYLFKYKLSGARKFNWKYCGIIAACFILAIIFISNISSTDNTLAHNGVSGDIQPMVFVNNTLYAIAPLEPYDNKQDDFDYIGTIKSTVSSSETPTKELQANDELIGSEVYQYGENIIVFCNEQYWIYYEYEKRPISGTVKFHDKTYKKADLSEETIRWLVWYNSLSEKEQLSINSIPYDLIDSTKNCETYDAYDTKADAQ